MATSAQPFLIRSASPEEAEGLARLHVTVWRQTYRDLAPPEAYEKLGVAKRLPYWTAALSATDPLVAVFVGVDDTGLAGVVSTGVPRDAALGRDAEIKHLYVRARARGTGLGKALMQEAFGHLASLGMPSASLAVVERNLQARAFYQKLGGTETGHFTDSGPLWRSENIVVRWGL